MTPRLTGASRTDDVDLSRDRALVERCQRGDTSAFDDLYLRYYARLVRFCLRKLRDPVEAEDTAQEAFARAWRALPSFNGERRFYPWLSVIASNLCVDIARRRARSTLVDDRELDLVDHAVDGGQEALIEDRDDREILVKAMNRLPPRYREVLELRERHEWSYQRIATHKGVELSTIETLLYRARRTLRREFMLLADGRVGVAGVIVALGNLGRLLLRRRSPCHPAGFHTANASSLVSGGAPTAGLAPAGTATGVGIGLAPGAAGLVVTAIAAGALVVVASIAPHTAVNSYPTQGVGNFAAQIGTASIGGVFPAIAGSDQHQSAATGPAATGSTSGASRSASTLERAGQAGTLSPPSLHVSGRTVDRALGGTAVAAPNTSVVVGTLASTLTQLLLAGPNQLPIMPGHIRLPRLPGDALLPLGAVTSTRVPTPTLPTTTTVLPPPPTTLPTTPSVP